MTKFSNKLKKNCFWPILGSFPNFLGKKNFPGKSSSVTHNFTWVSSIMLKFRKSLWYNSKKMPGQTVGRTDRPYFIGPFQLLPGVQKVTQEHPLYKTPLYDCFCLWSQLQVCNVCIFRKGILQASIFWFIFFLITEKDYTCFIWEVITLKS